MKGFTLVETLVSTAILTILFLAAFQIMDVGSRSWFGGDAVVELRQEIVKVFMKMELELKETRPAQVNLGAGQTSSSLTFKLPADNNGDGTILDSSGNMEWSGNITYALNGSHQITRTASTGTTIVANDISSLQFSRPTSPNNILQIDITASKTTATRRQIEDVDQIMIKMRN
jgi:prepilin-type N-terminal cleavage/methylation domain-containing protein